MLTICNCEEETIFADEISEVRSELQEEGFTPDEAAKLIQNVYRKVSASKSLLGSPRKALGEEEEETKSWEDAMGVMSNLMQVPFALLVSIHDTHSAIHFS